jgi:hypothetical protein
VNGDVDLPSETLERGRSGKNFAGHARSCEGLSAVSGREPLYGIFNAGERAAKVGTREALKHVGDVGEIDWGHGNPRLTSLTASSRSSGSLPRSLNRVRFSATVSPFGVHPGPPIARPAM